MTEPIGDIEISEDAVANIVAHCASRIPGVVALSEGLVGGISKFLRQSLPGQGDPTKGVRVEMTEKSVTVDLTIAVREGFPIPTVATAIQRSVKDKVEQMTGLRLRVERVNVFVRDIVSAAGEPAEKPPEPGSPPPETPTDKPAD